MTDFRTCFAQFADQADRLASIAESDAPHAAAHGMRALARDLRAMAQVAAPRAAGPAKPIEEGTNEA